jgi:hypothetical protein
MKASELRIGNYYDQFGNEHQVSWPTLKTLEEYPKDQVWCKPIPLTEEWLLKLGFHKWGIDDMPRTISYEKDWIRIFPSNSFCDFVGYGLMHYKPDPDKPDESARVKFEYVHQLQNLYFALTGYELEIK